MVEKNEQAQLEALLLAAKQGDYAAFNQLIALHKDEAYRIALRLCGHRQEAEEILQDAFERLVKYIHNYDVSKPFRPWFLSIVVNRAKSRYRRYKLRSLISPAHASAGHVRICEEHPENILSGKQVEFIIMQALQSLPFKQRQCFILKHVEGYSFEQMHEITGESVNNLKVATHRARKRLLELVNKQCNL